MKRRVKRIEKRGRKNPYFRVTNTRPKPILISFIIITLFLLGLFSFYIFASRFHIQSINIYGAEEDIINGIESSIQEHLDERIFFILPRRHPLLFSDASLKKDLLEKFPLNSVVVTRSDYTINITVVEKIRKYFVLNNDSLYSVDRSGYVIGIIGDIERIQISLSPSNNVPIIKIPNKLELTNGETVLNEKLFEKIVYVIDKIQSGTLLTTTSVEVIEEEQRLNVETDSGVALYLSLGRDMSDQISKLEALISRKLVDLEELTYIDLRYQNRLYYH